MSSNPFVFLIQALGFLLSCDRFADGIWTPKRTVSTPTTLPCAECCKATIDELGCGPFLGQLYRLDNAPFGGVSATRTLSTSCTYKEHCAPGNGIGHGGTAVDMSSNPFVFLIQALGFLLSCDRFADGIWTPKRTVSTPTTLPSSSPFLLPCQVLRSKPGARAGKIKVEEDVTPTYG
ncbi:hypothetical protein HPB50_010570 [Hyalomma asiaticum]|uniref:Uncharacterized protein n=1 Tax=Hyalomma asiaticum TaxID=266040 RepID=A0ACB7T7T1_HYAAI|nr:hypothetical protein HPB50_010570 [Hyalomma asiaticum]